MNLIKEIFTGRDTPYSEINSKNKEYRKAMSEIERIHNEVTQKYPEADKLMYDYENAVLDAMSINACNDFTLGFRLGARGRRSSR